MINSLVDKLWYEQHPLAWVLLPFSWFYRLVTHIRRLYLSFFHQQPCPVPLIVVGNLTVGGVGKTPLVIELAKKLQQKGLRVGIVSRGYGAQIKSFPHQVRLTDLASQVGDEPLMIAENTGCPVVIAPKRTEAVHYLLEHHQSQIIISDDGLQHYRMGRTIEIAVIDGSRGLGNGFCLPAGPLRESARRLKEVDFIVVNESGGTERREEGAAYSMNLTPTNLIKLSNKEEINPSFFTGKVAAIAGIGNPQRFYSTLSQIGIEFTAYSYPDHYQFKPQDLNYAESLVIMTEKDAVKCRSFISDKMYYLPVKAVLSGAFWDALWTHEQLKGYC